MRVDMHMEICTFERVCVFVCVCVCVCVCLYACACAYINHVYFDTSNIVVEHWSGSMVSGDKLARHWRKIRPQYPLKNSIGGDLNLVI